MCVSTAAKSAVMQQLRYQIRPEFINRIDDIILFSPLTKKEIKLIVRLQLNRIAQRLESQGLKLNASEEALDQLAILGFDPQYGGRPVKRVLQQHILNPLSKALLGNTIKKNSPVLVDYFEEDFIFRNESI